MTDRQPEMTRCKFLDVSMLFVSGILSGPGTPRQRRRIDEPDGRFADTTKTCRPSPTIRLRTGAQGAAVWVQGVIFASFQQRSRRAAGARPQGTEG